MGLRAHFKENYTGVETGVHFKPPIKQGAFVRSSWTAWVCLFLTSSAQAQLSTHAYRTLGQVDLRQNGLNRVQGVEMNAPTALALDNRDGALHLYVADTRNNR